MENILMNLEDKGVEVEDVLERLMGDEQLYLEYLEKFLHNNCVADLAQAIDIKDYERAAREVHTLKGVALNLGILPLADVCMDMLLDFRQGNNEAAIKQLTQVQDAFNRWVSIIKEAM